MTALHRSNIDVCVFDAYGTLFDTASAAARAKDQLGADLQPVSELWRRKQLEYTWLRSLMGKHTDFWHVTGESLDFALDAFGRLNDVALRAFLMQQYLSLDPFPDAIPTLERLRADNVRLAILSNGSPTMLTAAVNSCAITAMFDAVLSVEAAGVFKPSPRVYQLVVDRFDVRPERVCFLSSNGWDVAGAAAFGLRGVWVRRSKAPPERLPAQPEATVGSLWDLPAILGLA